MLDLSDKCRLCLTYHDCCVKVEPSSQIYRALQEIFKLDVSFADCSE